jgi:hypothetical protein
MFTKPLLVYISVRGAPVSEVPLCAEPHKLHQAGGTACRGDGGAAARQPHALRGRRLFEVRYYLTERVN